MSDDVMSRCEELPTRPAEPRGGGRTLTPACFDSSHLKPSVLLGSTSTEKKLPSCGQSDTLYLAAALPSSSPRGL